MFDTVLDLTIRGERMLMFLKLFPSIEQRTTAFGTHACGITKIQDWIFGGTKQYSLVFRWQETASPKMCAERLTRFVFSNQDNKRW